MLQCSLKVVNGNIWWASELPTLRVILGSLKTLQMRFQAAFILLARVKSKLPFNQNGAVVGLAPRQGGGLYVACLAVQHMVYVQPE